jgi:hypothetical protein
MQVDGMRGGMFGFWLSNLTALQVLVLGVVAFGGARADR